MTEKNKKELLNEFLRKAQALQIATAIKDTPWICTVFCVSDGDNNLYWLSLPSRRHSQEIAKNNQVAVAIAVKTDWPIIGVQANGKASVVNDDESVKRVMKIYSKKYNQGHDFYKNFMAGTNQHNLYKFETDQYILFDEQHFAGNPRQEINL